MVKRKKRVMTALLVLCICLAAAAVLPAGASAEGEIDRITVRTVKNYDPYVLDSVLDHSATVSSTGGAYTSQATWYDSGWNAAGGLFSEGTYTVEITVYASDGYSFSDSAVGYINNDPAEVTLVDSATAVLRRQVGIYTWNSVQIWKNPGDEKLGDGDDLASFVVSGEYFTDVSWTFTDADGNNVSMAKARERFPGASFDDARPDGNTARLNIHHVPAEMNGWKVFATFSNPTSSANTGKAKIIVEGTEPEPTPTPTPAPTPETGEDSEPQSTEAVTEAPAEEEHEHVFSAAWRNDENGHWHECECGEKSDFAAHSMNWTEVSKATGKAPGKEHGMCSVCGYFEDREVEYVEDSSVLGKIFVALIGVMALVIVVMIVEQVRYNRRRRQRQAYRKKYR